ncbi:MAG: hypothetical protein B6U88_01770 [Candidatus Aenigmarchaeota archaeon ex4484_56]|nr:MAG: hypothetical protein B6U88_01770 [Candidatus Aenigmarchaeota archaeon ex4484_56]
MKNLIVIPTYWRLPNRDNIDKFDHPAEINKKGTLPRLLKSFGNCNEEILIVPAPVCKKVEDKLDKIISNFENLNIDILRTKQYRKIINSIENKEFRKDMKIESYGNVKNIALLTGIIKKADNILFIDDDEIIVDKNFIKKSCEYIGKNINGNKILGKSGYYIDKNDNYKSINKSPKWKKYWDKAEYLDEFYKKIRSRKRLHDTWIALGGNMIVNKELFFNVPFDPYIKRGEDIDYVFNAKYFKFKFVFDNKMVVKHIPPKTSDYWRKMRMDIYRFIYEREKLKYLNFSIKSKYPKVFLGDDLEYRIVATNIGYAKYSLKYGRKKEFEEGLKNIITAVKDAKEYAEKYARKYFRFQLNWTKFVNRL